MKNVNAMIKIDGTYGESASNAMRLGASALKIEYPFLDARLKTPRPVIADDSGTVLQTNKSLKILYIQGGHLSPSSVKQYAKALEVNKTLEVIGFIDCLRGDNVIETILQGLKKNTTLKTLDLSGHIIQPKDAQAIIELIKHNKTLKEIRLTIIHSKKEVKEAIEAALEENTYLTQFSYSAPSPSGGYDYDDIDEFSQLSEKAQKCLERNQNKSQEIKPVYSYKQQRMNEKLMQSEKQKFHFFAKQG